MSQVIYKICTQGEWDAATRKGAFHGSEVDVQDGYIHFSTVTQVSETAAKHFAGQRDLVLVAVDDAALGDDLKWEVSRGGDLFPHLYAALPVEQVAWVKPLPLSAVGVHQFPDGVKP